MPARRLFVFALLGFGMTSGVLRADDCMRGDAEPWFRVSAQSDLSGYKFSRASRTESLESFRDSSLGTVSIRNSGCEYFTVTIRIERPTITGDQSLALTMEEAEKALQRLTHLKAHCPFSLQKAAMTFHRATKTGTTAGGPEGDGIPVQGDGADFLQTKVKISSRGQGFFEVELSKGPL